MPNFSSVAAPLSNLTRKGKPDQVRWATEVETALRTLEQVLTANPMLLNPDFQKPFVVHTDTLESGLGAALSQRLDGEEHPIVYVSRKLTPTETKYATVEREALAIKWAVLLSNG